MRIPFDGEPLRALVRLHKPDHPTTIECDVLVVGGGTGGVAAAWAAARLGRSVHITEETDWLGGQFTSQGVSALDEHGHIERFGGTRSYYQLRNGIRKHYEQLLDDHARGNSDLNPGSCWVSRLAFEPRVAVNVLDALLAPLVATGRLKIHYRTKAVGAAVRSDRIQEIMAISLQTGEYTRFVPSIVIDATELGDVLPLTGAEYAVGAESIAETGEPHAQPYEAKPHCVQSLTYTFAAELGTPGTNAVISKPDGYESSRDGQPYTLRIHVSGGEIYSEDTGWLNYAVLEKTPGTKGSLWEYRRLIDRRQFAAYPADISMFNWPSNDYRHSSVLDGSSENVARAFQAAKRVSLGFLYWLQTEAVREGRPAGYPEIALRPDIMGSADGLSKHPYIRESRRMRARKTIVEQEVSAEHQSGSRAAQFLDSVGVGWYPIDIHRAGADDVGASCRTKPFQIPLGALIAGRIENLIAASKNIGTTHITNGCYRVHPVEWNIGESAGTLAAFAIERARDPHHVQRDAGLLRRFQRVLAEEGVPLAWATDVPMSNSAAASIQLLLVILGDVGALEFLPDARLSAAELEIWGSRIREVGLRIPEGPALTRRDFAMEFARTNHFEESA
jgi:hypothetical protein